MERCDLTQVPCRKAIAEVVKANKSKNLCNSLMK